MQLFSVYIYTCEKIPGALLRSSKSLLFSRIDVRIERKREAVVSRALRWVNGSSREWVGFRTLPRASLYTYTGAQQNVAMVIRCRSVAITKLPRAPTLLPSLSLSLLCFRELRVYIYSCSTQNRELLYFVRKLRIWSLSKSKEFNFIHRIDQRLLMEKWWL